MDDGDLARRFERDRPRLRALAHRVLGSSGDAEDAVQEAWLRLARSDTDDIANLSGWLTTVVSRVCLDMLRSRRTRAEVAPSYEELTTARADAVPVGADPEAHAELSDSIGPALLLVLDRLAPAERIAFVLHDVFGVPFDEIAGIVGRSPEAARQLASRARRRVRGSAVPDDDLHRRRQVVEAFLAAAREGDFARLLELLAPDAVLSADAVAVRAGAQPEVRGAQAVAETFAGRARVARPALVDGDAGAVWFQKGQARVVFGFVVSEGRVVAIDLIADADQLARTRFEPGDGG